MPIKTECGRTNLLLDVFGHPEALRLLVVADTNATVSAADRKLLLIGTPADTGGRLVDAQHHKLGLPRLAVEAPHVRVLVCAACHNAIGLGRPVDAQYFGRVFGEGLRFAP